MTTNPAQDLLARALSEQLAKGQPPPCTHDPAEWYAADKTTRERAANKCANLCPLLEPCKAAGADESHGVWGGIDHTPTPTKKDTQQP